MRTGHVRKTHIYEPAGDGLDKKMDQRYIGVGDQIYKEGQMYERDGMHKAAEDEIYDLDRV